MYRKNILAATCAALCCGGTALMVAVPNFACSDDGGDNSPQGTASQDEQARRAEQALREAPRRCLQIVRAMHDAAENYRLDNKYYPGQKDIATIGSKEGMLTGSQALAKASFTTRREGRFPVTHYADYKDSALITADGREHVLSDRWPEKPMPICYYPCRFGVRGLAQYVEADNAAHTDAHKGGDFHEFIRDTQYEDEDVPYRPGHFLIIAPGPDRKYFTKDDIVNFNK